MSEPKPIQSDINSVEFFGMRDKLLAAGISLKKKQKDKHGKILTILVATAIFQVLMVITTLYYGNLMLQATPSMWPFYLTCVGITSFFTIHTLRINYERLISAKYNLESAEMFLLALDHLEKVMAVRHADSNLREKAVSLDSMSDIWASFYPILLQEGTKDA